jgi:hypothetical protein
LSLSKALVDRFLGFFRTGFHGSRSIDDAAGHHSTREYEPIKRHTSCFEAYMTGINWRKWKIQTSHQCRHSKRIAQVSRFARKKANTI